MSLLVSSKRPFVILRSRYMTLEKIAALSDDPIVKLPAGAA
jgi:hypothetical protein